MEFAVSQVTESIVDQTNVFCINLTSTKNNGEICFQSLSIKAFLVYNVFIDLISEDTAFDRLIGVYASG